MGGASLDGKMPAMNSRTSILVFASVALLALLALAAGLHDVHFNPAQWDKITAAQGGPSTFSAARSQLVFWAVLIIAVFLFFYVLLARTRQPVLPASPNQRLLAFIRLMIVAFTIFWLIQNRVQLGLMPLNLTMDFSASNPSAGSNPLPQTFIPPDISPATIYLLSLAFVVLTLGLLWFFRKRFATSATQGDAALPLEDIASAARASLDDLSAGHAWEDAIVRAYVRMNEVVARTRGLHRQQTMTAGEFALRLQHAGLPYDAVTRLTRLFESARYGARHAEEREKADAADCLTSILNACAETA